MSDNRAGLSFGHEDCHQASRYGIHDCNHDPCGPDIDMKRPARLLRFPPSRLVIVAMTAGLGLAACSQDSGLRPGSFVQVFTRGYVLQEEALDQVPVGSSRDQVNFVLGTPTTTATLDGDVYYYITQKVERIPGGDPTVIDQRVLAVYFDKAQRVTRIARYGLEDGRVIDSVSRKTATGGREQTFLGQVFQNLIRNSGN